MNATQRNHIRLISTADLKQELESRRRYIEGVTVNRLGGDQIKFRMNGEGDLNIDTAEAMMVLGPTEAKKVIAWLKEQA